MVRELLLGILEDLGDKDFRKFRWYLTESVVVGYAAIPKGLIESSDREDTVDKMVDRYCEEPAVTIAVEILKRMSHNAAAEKLKKNYAERKTVGQNLPAPASFASSASSAPPGLTVTAESGGVVIVPTLSNTTIGSSFQVNITK